jgi:large subunit ribosomal protein L21
MYAVIKTGGKQYKVATDDVIAVEKLTGKAGDKVVIGDVLMLSGGKGDGSDVVVGTPLVEGVSVSAEVVEQGRGDKIIVFKKKRRHNYRRKKGHRQDLTTLRILEILENGKAIAKAKKTTAVKPKAAQKAKAETKEPAVKEAEKAGVESKTKSAPKTTAKTKATSKTTAKKKTTVKKKVAPKKTTKKDES